MSLLTKLFGGSYDDLWKAVIRPTRDEYSESELGPEKFEIKGKFYKRTDFSIKNKRNLRLQCSFWEPYDEEREFERLPCVVYLHGNSSSRCEAVSEVKYLLPMNITFFAFDFAGCGKSEGDYISLGWYERDDVACVIEYLRKTNKVSTIGLWGRSMGAVTAIMYGDRDPTIAGLVLDSAFSSLKVLIEELVKDRVSLPNFILNQATKLVKSTISKKANFNLDEIEPIKYAEKCFIPALFCHGNGDNFVKVHHCKELYEVYPGDKNVVYVDGDHNTSRPRFFRDSASIFFYNTLQVAYINEISDNYNGFKFMIKSDNEVDKEVRVQSGKRDDEIKDFEGEDEEEMFKKILEMSKKEYEMCVNKQNEKNKENNNNNNNKEVNPNIKPIETDMIIFPPPDDDKVNNGDK
jgi:pimeloyl-ACP methyl ester carboxylesterase